MLSLLAIHRFVANPAGRHMENVTGPYLDMEDCLKMGFFKFADLRKIRSARIEDY